METIEKTPESNETDINELSFTELRDKLLALDPLNKDHVTKVNKAEAEYWRKSEGYRVGWSDEILGFDCGGQQWVSEICFPAGTLSKPSMKDLDYIENLKKLIQSEEIPAPAPIEQRWTVRSQSPMSPASSKAEDDIFSWVTFILELFCFSNSTYGCRLFGHFLGMAHFCSTVCFIDDIHFPFYTYCIHLSLKKKKSCRHFFLYIYMMQFLPVVSRGFNP